ncbi:2OG-Fe(II) oxygenase [uncultured Spongiibacter sp.]|uniref:2OG-Fe(II) oxygenase n=1 Tax=uncultured Spongiibacter sp. TaxID=870896 RepID=UPI002594EEF9|nr:2OG-Fe(II) oxygenase [uncultured Spongiibacter sp.]
MGDAVINYEKLFGNIDAYRSEFHSGVFEFVAIDDFLDSGHADRILSEFPDPLEKGIGKSRDYVFAKNKYEKSDFASHGGALASLYAELTSKKFSDFLVDLTGEDVFVDPSFHGGGLHQGGEGSYLNMHADFNYHPINKSWFRNLNILVYFNKDWVGGYGGQLKLKNKRTGESTEVEPLFNRCVIMFTRDYTLHGYDPIKFPKGQYRRSIAAYAYSEVTDLESRQARSTTWYPEDGGVLKKVLGKSWPKLVAIKTKFVGSSTAKNK